MLRCQCFTDYIPEYSKTLESESECPGGLSHRVGTCPWGAELKPDNDFERKTALNTFPVPLGRRCLFWLVEIYRDIIDEIHEKILYFFTYYGCKYFKDNSQVYGSASICLEGISCITFCIIIICTLFQSWESTCTCHLSAQTVLTIVVPGSFSYPHHIAKGFIILYRQYFMDLCYECLLFRICHRGKANSRRGTLDLRCRAKPKLFFIIINIALVTVQRWVVSTHLQMTLWRWATFVMILVSGFLAALSNFRAQPRDLRFHKQIPPAETVWAWGIWKNWLFH